jgi:hypothetical protein
MRRTLMVSSLIALALLLAGPASAAAPETQSFTVTFDLADDTAPGQVVAFGPITGEGLDILVSDRPSGRRVFHDLDDLVFGSDVLHIKINGRNIPGPIDHPACTGHFGVAGTYVVTGGEGAFADAKGHGHFSGEGTLQGTPDPTGPGGCNFDQATGALVIDAPGVIKL